MTTTWCTNTYTRRSQVSGRKANFNLAARPDSDTRRRRRRSRVKNNIRKLVLDNTIVHCGYSLRVEHISKQFTGNAIQKSFCPSNKKMLKKILETRTKKSSAGTSNTLTQPPRLSRNCNKPSLRLFQKLSRQTQHAKYTQKQANQQQSLKKPSVASGGDSLDSTIPVNKKCFATHSKASGVKSKQDSSSIQTILKTLRCIRRRLKHEYKSAFSVKPSTLRTTSQGPASSCKQPHPGFNFKKLNRPNKSKIFTQPPDSHLLQVDTGTTGHRQSVRAFLTFQDMKSSTKKRLNFYQLIKKRHEAASKTPQKKVSFSRGRCGSKRNFLRGSKNFIRLNKRRVKKSARISSTTQGTRGSRARMFRSSNVQVRVVKHGVLSKDLLSENNSEQLNSSSRTLLQIFR